MAGAWGPDVWGLGGELVLSAGSLHPWSVQLVHLHMHPREVLLDT